MSDWIATHRLGLPGRLNVLIRHGWDVGEIAGAVGMTGADLERAANQSRVTEQTARTLMRAVMAAERADCSELSEPFTRGIVECPACGTPRLKVVS